jgi:pimeloyl-ACP methyl ester carboxylesterase
VAPPLVAALCVSLAGCSADRPLNPSFPLTVDAARTALQEMDADPRTPPRPVVVIGGIFDSPARVGRLAQRLRALTCDDAVIVPVSVRSAASFDAALANLQAGLNTNPLAPSVSEVDVVGVSMGGLVARYAAMDPSQRHRADPEASTRQVPALRIRRLFTLATPHRGAIAAQLPVPQSRVRDMRAGSAFLTILDADLPRQRARGLELYPYVRRGDAVVGVAATAPPGEHPIWVANQPFRMAHGSIAADERILADIARRLRGEPPFSAPPFAPLPSSTCPRSSGPPAHTALQACGR